MSHALLVALTALALSARLFSEQPKDAPAFDVASVKPNTSGDEDSGSFVQPGGRYTATNVTVRMLVKIAYGMHDAQVIGGPSWVNTERFDIAAKAEGHATARAFRDQARLMLRPLLADRFKLVLRRERRNMPVYALVRARADGRFGPQFDRSNAGDCNDTPKSMPTASDAAEPGPPLLCGAEIYRPGHLAARSMTFSALVLNVSRWTDRVVIDRTGLDGTFDWDLQWTPEQLTAESPSTTGGLSLFAALPDQLGLRLERRRSEVEVIVIDRIERPVPD